MRSAPFSAAIAFSYEAQLRPWRLRAAKAHKNWLLRCLELYDPDRQIRRVQYYFVTEATIAQLHGRYLGEAEPTDIMTFGYSLPEGVAAEIYIAPQVVRKQARIYRTPPGEELRRVLAHGILHLLGWNDHTEAEEKAMRAAEEVWLRLWSARPTISVSHETQPSRL